VIGLSFTIIDNDLFEHELNIQEQSLLFALIRYYNQEKGYAYPSYSKLKKSSRIADNRTLINNINSLIKKDYIKKVTVKGIGNKYYILKFIPSVDLHLVENYTTCNNTPTHSVDLHYDLVENYTTTNTNTNTNIKTNKKEKESGLDQIINSYTINEGLKDTIRDFLKVRKAIKKPMTDKALTLILNKLDKLSNNELEKIEILNQSIVNSWQGVFELKDKKGPEKQSKKEAPPKLLGWDD
jgi:hypothetical protein